MIDKKEAMLFLEKPSVRKPFSLQPSCSAMLAAPLPVYVQSCEFYQLSLTSPKM